MLLEKSFFFKANLQIKIVCFLLVKSCKYKEQAEEKERGVEQSQIDRERGERERHIINGRLFD